MPIPCSKSAFEGGRVNTVANSVHKTFEVDAGILCAVLLVHLLGIPHEVLVESHEHAAERREPGIE